LSLAWFAQPRNSQTEEAQWPGHELLPGQEKATQPVDVNGFREWIFHRDLAGKCGEIAVAHLHLNGVRAEPTVFEAGGDVGGLGSQAGAKDFPVIGILEEGFLAADALDCVAQLKRAVIPAKGKALPEKSDMWHRSCDHKPCRFLAYVLLSGAVPGPTGAAHLFSWLGWGRLGVTAESLFPAKRPRVENQSQDGMQIDAPIYVNGSTS
jgi:hypothetical protein